MTQLKLISRFFYSLVLIALIIPNHILATTTVCPSPQSFIASTPIQNYNFTYPALLTLNSGGFLMFSGGITSQLPAAIKATLSSDRFRFPLSQEEIWVSRSSDLLTFSPSLPSFAVLPETKVTFKQNSSYNTVYPNGFKTGCSGLTSNTQCNVQINDPSAVIFNDNIYLYFTILENYRWYDGTQGQIINGNPSNPVKQNIHSIGLAVSSDNGQNWAFVDKVILENEQDTSGHPILGAWAPSAIVTSSNNVDIYFHDALGTKQYVAHLTGGVSLSGIDRLNRNDSTYRTNLDIIKNGNLYEATYNDSSFNIVRSYFKSPSDFGTLCPPTTIVPADSTHLWPTPHQLIVGDTIHLFFWHFQNPSNILHWSRKNSLGNNSIAGDLNSDSRVDIFDYYIVISNFGHPYTIADVDSVVNNYEK